MNLGILMAIAWRNLWRQRRRTLLTLLSITFGAFLSFMMTALEDRSFADFIDNAARLGSGHVALQHPEYRDTPTLTRSITQTDIKRHIAEADPETLKVVERITGQTMVSTASDSFGSFFVAYDPALETPDTLIFSRSVQSGKLFQSAKDHGIILGQALAHNLGADLGDKVVYTLTDRHGEIVTGMERLVGIVQSGAPSLDAALCLLPIDTVRSLIGYTDTEANQIAVFLKDGRQSQAVSQHLKAQLGPEVAVLTWDEVQPEIRAFVAMKVGGSQVIEVIVGLLVAAGIFNTIFMSVLERKREFGIMLALGYTAGQLFVLVMLESALLAGMGLVSAALVIAWPYHYMNQHGLDLTEVYAKQGLGSYEVAGVGLDPIMRIAIYPENAFYIALAIVMATLMAGVYPAWKAGRINPIESINLS